MERRFSFSAGVVGLAARAKDKQAVVADGNGTVSCIAVKVSSLLFSYSIFFVVIFVKCERKRILEENVLFVVVCVHRCMCSSFRVCVCVHVFEAPYLLNGAR